MYMNKYLNFSSYQNKNKNKKTKKFVCQLKHLASRLDMKWECY